MPFCSFIRLSLIFWLAVSFAMAAPKAKLWDRWLSHDSQATLQVDHSPWSRFLSAYLIPGKDGVNLLAYGQVAPADRLILERYITSLANIPVSQLNRSEQKAFWINLYNALTVQVVLDHYPVESIRDIDISPGFFANGPWGKQLVRIEGEAVSLDDIEHRILRPIWKDPRIHYGVNCASIGCPNLQLQAFTAKNTDALLDKGARDYINHPRGVRVAGNRLIVSSIYDWFIEDFNGNDEGVIAHLQRYAEPGLREQLQRFNRISDHEYDWSLNDIR